MSYSFKLRRGPAAEWTTDNPVLRDGEPGVENDTGKFKIGDGVHSWSSLPYFINQTAINALIEQALEDAVIEGVPGPEGPAGPEGPPGADGADGQDGADGAQGPPGADGADGSDGAQGIQGIQGIQGVKGDTGDTGPTGPAGADGSDGESVTVTLVDPGDWPPASDSNPLHLYFRLEA